jgi:hypothetical protein
MVLKQSDIASITSQYMLPMSDSECEKAVDSLLEARARLGRTPPYRFDISRVRKCVVEQRYSAGDSSHFHDSDSAIANMILTLYGNYWHVKVGVDDDDENMLVVFSENALPCDPRGIHD